MRVNYAIAFVSGMARSVAFYRDVLGLSVKFETPGWTEFITEGATFALHATGPYNSSENGPPNTVAGHWRSGFEVPDLDEFHRRMIESGVPCSQKPKYTFGVRIAQYIGPDGLVIGVSEEKIGGYDKK